MRIERHVLDAIVDHAREARPDECCGILLGRPDDPTTVVEALRGDNIDPGRRTDGYLLDHLTQLQALDMEVEGRVLVAGYYHSHPHGDARPSRRDLQHAVADTTYLVIGMAGASVEYATWRFSDGGVVRERLEVMDEDQNQTQAS